jgi:putative transposase
MPSHLKHYHTFGHDHLITFSCYHRLPYLNDDHAGTVFLDTLERIRQKHQFHVFDGWPKHLGWPIHALEIGA